MVNGVERIEKYQQGGYHPVQVDDVLHGRYHIVDKLGHGGYSTIWVASDERTNRLVAVKVGLLARTDRSASVKLSALSILKHLETRLQQNFSTSFVFMGRMGHTHASLWLQLRAT